MSGQYFDLVELQYIPGLSPHLKRLGNTSPTTPWLSRHSRRNRWPDARRRVNDMLDILEAVSTDLEPTRTYQRRAITFIPTKEEYRQRTGMIGELLVKLQHSKNGVRRAVEVDAYGVEPDQHAEPGDHGGKAYWLVNLTDKTQERPYRCVVGGLTPKCDCKASQCKIRDEDGALVCKHHCSLRWLTENGFI